MAKKRMENYTFRELEKIVVANGYSYVRCNGDHCIYKRNDTKKMIVLTRKKRVNPCIARRIIRENGLMV